VQGIVENPVSFRAEFGGNGGVFVKTCTKSARRHIIMGLAAKASDDGSGIRFQGHNPAACGAGDVIGAGSRMQRSVLCFRCVAKTLFFIAQPVLR
jgi:hypothetical protein